MTLKIIFLCTLLSAAQAFAEQHAMVETGLRYDNINWGEDTSRLQEKVKIGYDYLDDSRWSFHILGDTGYQYTSDWSTLYDFKKQKQGDQDFNLRRLYVQKNFSEKDHFQLGVIPPSENPADVTLSSSGWIDGARVLTKVWEGAQIFTEAGSLNDFDNPRVFNRDRRLNYASIAYDQSLGFFDRGPFQFELAQTAWEDEAYTRFIMYWPHLYDDWKLRFYVQVLHQWHVTANNSNTGFSINPLTKSTSEFLQSLSLSVNHMYISDSIFGYGKLIDDYYRTGDSVTIVAKGNLSFTPTLKNFIWMLKNYINSDERYYFSLSYHYEF